ncbi:hypothetical protein [Aquimarina longa]|uniref:hypothetical protein n=1 Tax=Aquimarina longa TaxID=1080221 RepID=UPI000784D571|nr:hypothetical protein [Aquimarina longa]
MKKSKNILNIGLTLIALLMIFSCENRDSTDLPPSIAVYQDLLVRYQTNTKNTLAKATFRTLDKNGTRLVLKGESKILFNNKKYDKFSTIFDYFYEWKEKELIDVEFNYVKNKTISFKNKISFKEASTIEIPTSFNKVKLDGTTKLKWKGSPLQKNEEITISFHQGDKGATGGVKGVDKGNEEISIDGLFIKGMKKGKAILRLIRSKELEGIQQSDGKNNGRRTVEVEVTKEVIVE